MPKKPSPAKSSHADLLADAAAAWAEVAPPPLITLRDGIDFTAQDWATKHALTYVTAQRHLDRLTKVKDAILAWGEYRLPGRKQPQKVYYPIVAGPPG